MKIGVPNQYVSEPEHAQLCAAGKSPLWKRAASRCSDLLCDRSEQLTSSDDRAEGRADPIRTRRRRGVDHRRAAGCAMISTPRGNCARIPACPGVSDAGPTAACLKHLIYLTEACVLLKWLGESGARNTFTPISEPTRRRSRCCAIAWVGRPSVSQHTGRKNSISRSHVALGEKNRTGGVRRGRSAPSAAANCSAGADASSGKKFTSSAAGSMIYF